MEAERRPQDPHPRYLDGLKAAALTALLDIEGELILERDGIDRHPELGECPVHPDVGESARPAAPQHEPDAGPGGEAADPGGVGGTKNQAPVKGRLSALHCRCCLPYFLLRPGLFSRPGK